MPRDWDLKLHIQGIQIRVRVRDLKLHIQGIQIDC